MGRSPLMIPIKSSKRMEHFNGGTRAASLFVSHKFFEQMDEGLEEILAGGRQRWESLGGLPEPFPEFMELMGSDTRSGQNKRHADGKKVRTLIKFRKVEMELFAGLEVTDSIAGNAIKHTGLEFCGHAKIRHQISPVPVAENVCRLDVQMKQTAPVSRTDGFQKVLP